MSDNVPIGAVNQILQFGAARFTLWRERQREKRRVLCLLSQFQMEAGANVNIHRSGKRMFCLLGAGQDFSPQVLRVQIIAQLRKRRFASSKYYVLFSHQGEELALVNMHQDGTQTQRKFVFQHRMARFKWRFSIAAGFTQTPGLVQESLNSEQVSQHSKPFQLPGTQVILDCGLWRKRAALTNAPSGRPRKIT
eukprot:NODE_834_length_1308_cov_71.227164_g611_i0.p1 GENE.NODE_834_length_1308_cov_71.227164_g611_i0~~NODE_834_length_1308_cov_71.227164_g611_i0.p1  ORF type:complete len:193 (+),score=21.60 NODE_834_length_1308_cov_71.227164_g611_i0:95-673(+)